MRNIAFIALGSNINTREEFLQDALTLLDEHASIQITNKSAVYETAPVGYTDQADFLNMVIRVETDLAPSPLLAYCQVIEEELGRRRVVKWGPRTIDLDILLYNQEGVNEEHLKIPHPYMQDRAFVMVPLVDISCDVVLPHLNRKAQDVLERIPEAERAEVKRWGNL
ncbi:2-amino-4-hydroxy-6-hydroxymethyldihydropteridine diphosphokinase [Halobacillus sp. ACCC02827]|uniref:2-amino-4-hydroxy-6- hydroxymethyldihydropteridine diphosphokinase n=1 Tax=Bacillaceae TaxID=186817 RepID=UPI0002A5202C|nr:MULTISPECIES: 2-amino-4-hydroxy-6-hydroxymethyldihydropteridine diphosphokinase [Bacillaceae]ELK48370.1 2-amino-4-hydroxy-6-hydroxymethyldihydropteridine pyrophosphokinase [Halobacillus sp. BAB-2008]QHT45132.1 2-amino-4-hydroxy-6-hydroxymethyldihydropteridine diphosphokinase [Bacillus sp. SB49]WJE15907.1 2-amino-4-hydroxy-6-hydroxymethyldihydropteridine diphosphokinase [Halobacillus sp. ACCC02827]